MPELILSGHAGTAYRLDVPPKEAISIDHPDGIVTIPAGIPFVSVALRDSHNRESARHEGWRVVQEALDFWAARTRTALATTYGDQEYAIWIRNGKGYALTYVDTATSQWSMSAQIQVVNSSGDEVDTETAPIKFFHHPSLRFYRLSQLSRDLLDAYRNAYLSLECLVSTQSSRNRGESELCWLKRVINGPLASGVPIGLDIEKALEELYKDGRNPIFHAKANETFYSPGGMERELVQLRFETLTELLASLLRFKLGQDVIGGWGNMSQHVEDASARVFFDFDEFSLCEGRSEVVCKPEIQVFEAPRRFGNLWCRASVEGCFELESMSELKLSRNGQPWMNCRIFHPLPLSDVNSFSFEMNLLQHHVKAPKPSHPM